MIFLLKLAFKNILRNKRRTFLTGLSISIAVIAMIYTSGFFEGVYGPFEDILIELNTGHIKIVPKNYIKKEKLLPINIFVNYIDIENNIENIKNIKSIKPRIKMAGLIVYNRENIDGMLIMGLLPEREKDNVLIKNNKLNRGEILISEQFAEKHGIKINDTLVIINKTRYGYLNGNKFIVKEFYKTDIRMIANTHIFINLYDAQFLLSYKRNMANELIIMADKPTEVYNIINMIYNKNDNYEIVFYLSKNSLIKMIKISIITSYIFLGILYLLSSIAVVNTMIMSLFARKKEIGMMKALGLNNKNVFLIFTFETIFITLLGVLIGVAFGSLITYYFQVNGLDMTNAMKGINMPVSNIWYTKLTGENIIIAIIMGVFSGLFSSLFLIRRIWKFSPVKILRE